MPHPALQSYAETLHHDFPLILAIGREPNTDRPIQGEHGCYDFDAAPRCGFWNVSYGTIAATVDLTTAGLKASCRVYHGAPLIYADALPIGLKNQIVNKYRHRQLDAAHVHAHIQQIFGYQILIQRVHLVLMSGLDHPVFTNSRAAIAEQCINKGIPYYHLPFFYGSNAPRIRAAMTVELSQHIQHIVSTFLRLNVPADMENDNYVH